MTPPLLQFGPPWRLADLLGTTSVEEFLSGYWCREPLHVERSRPDYYSQLFGVSDINRYLAIDGFFGRYEAQTVSRRPGPPDPLPLSVREVYERMHLGDSLRLRQMESYIESDGPLRSTVRDLEYVLQHPLDSISCYLSPRAAVGLGPHYDETEIFTLQVTGSKTWKFFHQVDLVRPATNRDGVLDPPTSELIVEPGDLLYVPAGRVHEVTSTEPSLSLTIVFQPVRWNSVAQTLMELLEPNFRQPVPPGVLIEPQTPERFRVGIREHIAEMRALLAEISVDAVADELAWQQLRRMPGAPYLGFANPTELAAIDAETRVNRRPDVPHRFVTRGKRTLLVLQGNNGVEISSRDAPLLRKLLDFDGPFQLSELGCDTSVTVDLARQLVAAGLLDAIPKEQADG